MTVEKMIGDSDSAVLAVDVGGSAIKAGFATTDGQLHQLRTVPTEAVKGDGGIVAGLAKFIREAASAVPDGLKAAVVGLVVPGIVDSATGTGTMSTMLGWRDAPIRDCVQDATGLPTVLGHDVSAAAMAEGRWGAGRGHQDWIFLALGTGLGSALVLNGMPYRGSNGWGGELSHFVARADGPHCSCGKQGCLEMLSTASAVAARYHDVTGEDLSAAEVASRVEAGDPVAGSVWDDAVDALIVAVAATVESLNPSAVVVGGGMANAGALLFDPLTAGVQRNVAFVQPTPVVLPAQLGVYAGVHGAALLGLERLDNEARE